MLILMAEIKFKDLEFNDDNDKIKVVLYRLFYFHIPRNELENIADFKIGRNHIEFKDVSEKKANNKNCKYCEYKNTKHCDRNKQ